MSTKYKRCIPMALLLAVGTSAAQAESSFPEFSFEGFIDARISRSSGQQSFFEGGLGKTRYGTGEDGDNATRTNLAEVSLLATTKYSWSLSSFVHVKFDPEQKNNIDIVEAFVTYKPLSSSAFKFKARLGTFFPPMTLENTDIAWTSPYSITSSAINSWIGEEIKPTGLEITLDYGTEDHDFSVVGGAFIRNDPAGVLLAWRGWAFQDSKSTIFGRFSLPDILAIGPDGAFTEQAPFTETSAELDSKIGFYGGFDWDYQGIVAVNGLYYTNRGDPEALDGKQYAWDTEFLNIGVKSDIAWTSPYSITSSAINSWIGEEIKPTGLEITLDYGTEDHDFSVVGGAFIRNDPAGVLLAWRGWAFQDSKSTIFGRFSLPDILAIGPDGAFTEQAPFTETSAELDSKIGFYGGFDWDYQGIVAVNGLYYTNRGDPEALDGKQYAWDTEFLNIGVTLNLIEDFEIFGQIMTGNTKMGGFPFGGERRAVDVDFDSFYIMMSKTFGPHRISARFDDFSTTDLAFAIPIDLNNENGHSWLVSYSVDFFETHRLIFELLQVNSDRENRVDFGIDTYQKETQLQASYRVRF